MYNDAPTLDIIGRLMIAGFFLIVGLRNMQKHHIDDHIDRLAKAGAPMPAVTFWAGHALEFVGVVLVLGGWYAEVGVWCLIAFTVLATALLLRFWEADNPMMRTGLQNGFLANIAVLGGLVLLLQNVR